MRSVGLHLRFYGSYRDLFLGAQARSLDTFQTFLLDQTTRRYVSLSRAEQEFCVAFKREHFGNLYIHGSYLSNIAGYEGERHAVLERELELAQRLEFSHFVIHPGSWPAGQERLDGIMRLARVLNDLYRRPLGITILLENTAHGGRSLGGDLEDFYELARYLESPEKLRFCLDSAHAHSYGYDIITDQGRKDFFALVERTMGAARCELLHINDTKNECASGLDQHEVVGHGLLGDEVLRAFANDPRVAHVPIILEMPQMCQTVESDSIKKIRAW